MLSLFPVLLSYEMLAPFVLRVTLGAVFIVWAYAHLKSREHKKKTALGVLDAIVGLLLIIGLYTQLAALVAVIMLLIGLIMKAKKKTLFSDGINYYFILLVIAFSLVVLGAGAFAFDLPL